MSPKNDWARPAKARSLSYLILTTSADLVVGNPSNSSSSSSLVTTSMQDIRGSTLSGVLVRYRIRRASIRKAYMKNVGRTRCGHRTIANRIMWTKTVVGGWAQVLMLSAQLATAASFDNPPTTLNQLTLLFLMLHMSVSESNMN
uniref:Uncharacterized protein n=1 Tax=Opuntia streptacantha TaxID=393608 RepID=A0A7C8YW93_OPUST